MSKKLTRGLCLGLMIGLVAPAAMAEDAPPPMAAMAPKAPAIEPKAVELLKAASAALARAQDVSFNAVSTYEKAAATASRCSTARSAR